MVTWTVHNFFLRLSCGSQNRMKEMHIGWEPCPPLCTVIVGGSGSYSVCLGYPSRCKLELFICVYCSELCSELYFVKIVFYHFKIFEEFYCKMKIFVKSLMLFTMKCTENFALILILERCCNDIHQLPKLISCEAVHIASMSFHICRVNNRCLLTELVADS